MSWGCERAHVMSKDGAKRVHHCCTQPVAALQRWHLSASGRCMHAAFHCLPGACTAKLCTFCRRDAPLLSQAA